jgi:hypothetical protein
LQYVLGLRRLGHETLYLEDTGWYYDPWSRTYCDRWSGTQLPKASRPPAFLDSIFRQHDLGDRWTWFDIDGTAHGVTGRRLTEFLAAADLLVHVTGGGILRDQYMTIPHRAWIDTDPGRVQMRAATPSGGEHLQRLRQHTVHFSFGCRIGSADCDIPSLGLTWHPTRQPLDLDLWPIGPPQPDSRFTTIMKWAPYQPIEYHGKTYGMKDIEFAKFVRLPELTRQPIEVAMEGRPPRALQQLKGLGWQTRDALEISASLTSYRQFIQQSRGEWSVAKHCYVASRSGWFSDRSAAYLASGRPVMLQSTGFEEWLPTGAGLFAFSTPDDVLWAMDQINADYQRHCRVAREIAERYFDASKILTQLVDVAMSSP